MGLIAAWVTTAKPDVMVVDVSVEVAMLVRLLGVPVVVVAMPGDRTDAPHNLVYRVADHILAAWPRDLYDPPWLRPHAAKTTYVGGISRFDGRARTARPPGSGTNVLVLNGAGGSSFDLEEVDRCAAAHPEFHWAALGVAGGTWAEDPWPALCAADVVVSSAGQSAVADIAAAGRPAIIVPAQRPFAEQHATSGALARGGTAVGPAPLAPPRGVAGADRSRRRPEPRCVGLLADPRRCRPRGGGDRTGRHDTFPPENTVKTAVITAVRGRTTHLRNQLKSLAHSTVQPGHHVLVAIDDDDVPAAVPAADHRTTIIAFTSGMARIPMAAARNLGAEAALAHGADLLIFLDVDCIPAPDMIGRYVRAAHHPDHRNALLCGPVTYLPAPGPVATIWPGCTSSPTRIPHDPFPTTIRS